MGYESWGKYDTLGVEEDSSLCLSESQIPRNCPLVSPTDRTMRKPANMGTHETGLRCQLPTWQSKAGEGPRKGPRANMQVTSTATLPLLLSSWQRLSRSDHEVESLCPPTLTSQSCVKPPTFWSHLVLQQNPGLVWKTQKLVFYHFEGLCW